MTLQQDNGFGRRGATHRGPGSGPSPIATPGSPLLKQIGGILLGVAIAFALGATFVLFMKHAGRTLDRKFVETATPGAPDEAIKRVKNVDANLQAVQQTCTERAKTARLSTAQERATDGYTELASGEDELARGAAFVECLATVQPARFCQAPHKAHLVEAVRQYFKLKRQMQEAWFMATGGPGGAQKAALTGAPYRFEQRVALAMPSAVTSPAMLAGLRVLAADGHVAAKDFGGFAGTGVPPDLGEALNGVQPKRATCR